MIQEATKSKKMKKKSATKASGVKKAVGGGRTKAASSKAQKPSKLLKSLPESMENLEVIQQVAQMLEELRDRAKDVKDEASKEVEKLIKRYEGTYKDIEKRVHAVSKEAKKQAQISMMHLMQKWYETKENWPNTFSRETEKILNKIGMKKETFIRAAGKKASASRSAQTAKAKVKKKASSETSRKEKDKSVKEQTMGL